ncbi:riboflavin biosynthesis protein RibA [Chitiniphilus eburneus]|uniref:Riboflavin biosynthesis protein RibA n=1 Tax=Chitiniphilus eburneus TaxID=2571148 RepID=A0A4U0QG17_9NEIS|nr:riboflavin biosynthesis protein RibA [Chitiniphilus eburneus]TJZ74824.1 riboflavin biosynthesis protein RibA [Chitiniphilus eburneus]
MLSELISGERARTKIAALFDSESAAANAANRVQRTAGVPVGQVQLVCPGERHFGRKLEPETRGIVRTAIRAHVTLGLAGAVLGLIVYGVLYIAGNPAVVSSPYVAAVLAAVFGLVFGLLAGGLATARPDHQAVVTPVRDAIKAGRWAVVVHPASPQQCDDALKVLHGVSNEVVRTI